MKKLIVLMLITVAFSTCKQVQKEPEVKEIEAQETEEIEVTNDTEWIVLFGWYVVR